MIRQFFPAKTGFKLRCETSSQNLSGCYIVHPPVKHPNGGSGSCTAMIRQTQRQDHLDRCPASGRVDHDDLSLHQAHQTSDNGQPQPRALVNSPQGAIRLDEGVENLTALFLGNAGTVSATVTAR
jgi:hypothetical protein